MYITMTSVLIPILTHDQRGLRSNSQKSFTPNRGTVGQIKINSTKNSRLSFCKILIKRLPMTFHLNGNTVVGFCTQISKVNRQKPRYHMVNFVAPFLREIEDL